VGAQAVYVGVDVGTSMTKAAAFDGAGAVLATHAVPTRLATAPGGVVEQEIEDVVASVGVVTRAVSAAVGARPGVVAVTGQGDGLWLVDGAGRGVRPAISWMDGRAATRLDRWVDEGLVDRVFRRTGNVMFPGCPAPLMSHLDETEPAALDRAAAAVTCKDVIFRRLTGVLATEVTDASVPFLDPATRAYAEDVIGACGLAHRRGLLAPIQDPPAPAALSSEGAALTGLGEGTPAVAAPFDLPACAAGAGVTAVGDGLLIIGTTLACLVVADRVSTEGEATGFHLAQWQPGRWLRSMPAMVGTASLDWMLATVGVRHDQLDALLAGTAPGAGGVSVLPFFASSGERAPFVEPAARAELAGVDLRTTREQLVRATCEGIAYAARHCFEAAGLGGELWVCGGGAQSRGWLEIFASVLGRPLRLARGPEVGARGAALTAARRLGLPVDHDAWTAPAGRCEPSERLRAVYDEGYAAYRRRLDAARARWRGER
jgi:sugar (pentulose or hexulose) kinase